MYRPKQRYIENSDSATSLTDSSYNIVDRSRPRPHLQHQVSDLCNELGEGDQAMSQNAALMSHFRTSVQNRSAELSELKRELDRSNELLTQQTKFCNGKCVHRCTCTYTSHNCSSDEATHAGQQRMASHNIMERERLARERDGIEKSHLLDSRHPSLSASYSAAPISSSFITPTDPNEHKICHLTAELTSLRNEVQAHNDSSRTEAQLKELAREIKQLKGDMWKKGANGRQKQLLKELKRLESRVNSDREQHTNTAEELASLVYELKKELEHVHDVKQKAHVEHVTETTTQELTVGKESLVKQINDLQQQLRMSEETRLLSEQRCLVLQEKYAQQESEQHLLREKVQDVEAKVFDYQNSRNVLLEKFNKVSALLAVSKNTEAELREQCHELQAQVMEKSVQDEILRGKVAETEKGCSETRQEVSQLREDLSAAEFENNTLLQRVAMLESQLSQSENDCDHLREHTESLSLQLQACEQERTLVVEHEASALGIVKDLEEKNQTLKMKVSDLENRVEQQVKKFNSYHSQATLALKKYKAQCNHLTKEKQKMVMSLEQSVCRCEELQKQLLECQSTVHDGNSKMLLLSKENEDLKIKVHNLKHKSKHYEDKSHRLEALATELQRDCETNKLSLEKCQEESVKLLSDNKAMAIENTSLQQELTRAIEESSIQVAQRDNLKTQHQNEIERLESSIIALNEQLQELNAACKYHEAEVSAVQSQDSTLKRQKLLLEKQLKHVKLSLNKKEEESTKEMETLQVAHQQRVDKLIHKHGTVVSSLNQKVADLQVKLADEQSALQVVRKQQLEALDNHQRTIEEDLARSLSDSEKVKHKYFVTKKHFQEKVALLEERLTVSESEENADLRQLLSQKESQILHVYEEHKTLLKVLTVEVDVLVDILRRRVDIPEFTEVALGQDTKTCVSEILAKLQWLKKEVVDLVVHEENLRRLLNHHGQ